MDPLAALLLELGARAKAAESQVMALGKEIETLKAEIEKLRPKAEDKKEEG